MREFEETIKLAGEFHARLTPSEANEWTEFIRSCREWGERRDASARMEALLARQMGTETNLEEAIVRAKREREAIEERVYDIAKHWYGKLCERRAREEEVMVDVRVTRDA